MIAALIRTTLWVATIDALAGAALLGFLYTPESNVLMLTLSSLLVLLAAMLLVLASASASHALVHDGRPWTSLLPAARRLPLALLAIVVIGVICAGAGWFERWWMGHAGEFDAAAIAAGDITRTGGVHTAVRWFVAFVQWVVVPAWCVTVLAWIAAYEWRDVLTMKWLTAALHWRVLVIATAAVVLLVWAPWQAVYWRPRALPASTLEAVFAAVKLIAIYLLAQLAWATLLLTAAARVRRNAAMP